MQHCRNTCRPFKQAGTQAAAPDLPGLMSISKCYRQNPGLQVAALSICHQHMNLQTMSISWTETPLPGSGRTPQGPGATGPQWPHLKHQLCFLLLQLRALPLHHNAQQLVLQALRSDHAVQQSDLHAVSSSDSALSALPKCVSGRHASLTELSAKPAGQEACLAASSQLLLCCLLRAYNTLWYASFLPPCAALACFRMAAMAADVTNRRTPLPDTCMWKPSNILYNGMMVTTLLMQPPTLTATSGR